MSTAARTSPVSHVIRLAAILSLVAAAGAFTAAAVPVAPPAPRTDREGFVLPAQALARVGSARLRHGGGVANLDYSPDGRLLASSGSGWIRLWDARTGKLVRQVGKGADGGGVVSGFLSADGTAVVAVDGNVCYWVDVRTGSEVRRCPFLAAPDAVDAYLAPRGEKIAVVSSPTADDLAVYELPSGRECFRVHSEWQWVGRSSCMTGAVAFSPDGKRLAALELHEDPEHYRVWLFETATGKTLGRFDAGGVQNNLAFSRDGTKLLGCGGGISVWSVPSGKSLHRLDADMAGPKQAVFTPDGKSVVVGRCNSDTLRFDLATGKETGRFRTSFLPGSFAFTPDGKTMATGAANGAVTQWDLATGKRLDASADPVDGFWQPRFDATGKIVSVCSDGVTTFDWAAGRAVRRVSLPQPSSGPALAISADRTRAVGAGADSETAAWDPASEKRPCVWDLASGKRLCVLPVPLEDPRAAPPRADGRTVFSPDGNTLYTAACAGESVRVWDATTGKEKPAIAVETRGAAELLLSADGRHLAVADPMPGDGHPRVTVWDVAGKRPLGKLSLPESGRHQGQAFSPDGNLLAAVGCEVASDAEDGNGYILLWDLRTDEKNTINTGASDELTSVAFSADGRTLATGQDDGTVRLWEVGSGLERHRFAGHECSVNEVAFSPDGKLLASTGVDAPVFIWDVEGHYGKPPSAEPFAGHERAGLWAALDDPSAVASFNAMRRLLARPGPAVALLRERLRPAAAVDQKAVRLRLRDLDANAFAVRERATVELEALADRAASSLRKALADGPTAEARRRIERVLEAVTITGPGRRREARAVEVLDRLATAEAQELLGVLASGTDEAFLTREARAAVGRLKAR
jgi:WD40 repeat protein